MTQVTNAYEAIVLELDKDGQRIGISKKVLETKLSKSNLGVIRPAKLKRHIELMISWGYLKHVSGQYDLVGRKVDWTKRGRLEV